MFSDNVGIVSQEFVSPGQTVIKHSNRETVQCLWEQVSQKRQEKWCNQDWFISHENAPAHSKFCQIKIWLW
jgi:hypothetical protein